MPDLWTIGYEATAWPPFLATLKNAGITHVIDVRQLPLSRRPGFSKTPLRNALAEAGIAYTHLRPLGTPPEGREANKRREWDRFWSIVDQSLTTPEAAHALEQAAQLAQTTQACLLCYEADPHICHRLRIAHHLERHHAFATHHLHPEALLPKPSPSERGPG